MDEDSSREAWLAHQSRQETRIARLKRKQAKTKDNVEKYEDVPKRGLPVIIEQDPEEAIKKASACCCLLCGREHHLKIVPLNSVMGELYTGICLRCKSIKGWYRFAASVGLNLYKQRQAQVNIKRRRLMWKGVIDSQS